MPHNAQADALDCVAQQCDLAAGQLSCVLRSTLDIPRAELFALHRTLMGLGDIARLCAHTAQEWRLRNENEEESTS